MIATKTAAAATTTTQQKQQRNKINQQTIEKKKKKRKKKPKGMVQITPEGSKNFEKFHCSPAKLVQTATY